MWVWAPVQIMQQTLVPLHYRVSVANLVSYFWDTYLSMMMSPAEVPQNRRSNVPALRRYSDGAG